MQDTYSIDVEGLTKRFAKKPHRGLFRSLHKDPVTTPVNGSNYTIALNNINLKIGSGELFGLLGPNGSGKTTLIKCLSTILIPDEGKILVNGFDVQKETYMVRASLGLVIGGERTLYWKLTARDNLLYFSSLYKMPPSTAKKRVDELLGLFQLSDRADERLENYSSGMRQKVVIARALLHDPPVILLDEPTLGLDPTFSRQLRKIIKDISQKYNKTILLTTHYMDEAEQLCNRLGFINKGNIIAIDNLSRLKDMVKAQELVEVMVCNPLPDVEIRLRSIFPKLEVIKDITGDESEVVLSKIKIIGESAEAHVNQIVDELRRMNVDICGLNVAAPTLEDVFIKLTGAGLSGGKNVN
jgi:ABC-2 type transport system ATP-binding protein